MRALSDLVCAASSCPSDIDASNGWHLTEIQVRVYPKDAPFKRSIGYRMSPDAPLQADTRKRASTRAPPRSRAPSASTAASGCRILLANAGAIEEYWACRERPVIMDLSPLA